MTNDRVRLATLPRSQTCELRIEWVQASGGSCYLDLSDWNLNHSTAEWIPADGVRFQIRDLRALRRAVDEACARAVGFGRPREDFQHTSPADRQSAKVTTGVWREC